MRPSDAEVAKHLRDLLVINKLAMPPKLFGEDPCVTRALALIRQLESGGSPSRTPNASARPPSFDITVLASKRAVAESGHGISFLTELPWDLVDGLMKAEGIPLDPAEAVAFIVRDWLTAQGNLPLPSAKEDAD